MFQAVKNHTVVNCICHGVSVSCLMKTCWVTMTPFSAVSRYLRERYDNSVLVTVDQNGKELVVAKGKPSTKPSQDSLVFLQESPDYCLPNPNLDLLGTTGRVCYNSNTTAEGDGSCGNLCCGRGFNTIQLKEEYKCRCKFVWCCDVMCSTCRRNGLKHVCKSPEEYISATNSSDVQSFMASVKSYDQGGPDNRESEKAKKQLRKARKSKKKSASGHLSY